MFDIAVTRQQYGGNNLRDTDIFSDQPTADPSLFHTYYNDFDDYVAANWTDTATGAPAATALVSGDSGILSVFTGGANTNYTSFQKLFPSFTTQANRRLWGRFIFSVDALTANLILGHTNVTTTPFTGGQLTDGIWLSMATGGALSVNVAAGGTIATQAAGVSAVAGTATTNFIRFSYYWDGANYPVNAGVAQGRVVWQLDTGLNPVGSGLSANARGEFSFSSTTALPAGFPGATGTTITFAAQTTTAAARTLFLDQIYLNKERYSILATPSF